MYSGVIVTGWVVASRLERWSHDASVFDLEFLMGHFWPDVRQDAVANFRRPTILGMMIGFVLSSGFSAMVHYRVARRLLSGGRVGKFLSRLIWRRSVRINGCDIGPTAIIGAGLCLPHTVGIVIGAGSVIEPGVSIYQGVTLGQKGGQYPLICRGATILPGAVVVGGIRVGVGATVGEQSFVARDVEDGQVVAGAPAKPIMSRGEPSSSER